MPAATETSVRTLLAGQLHLDAETDLDDFWTNITPTATAEAEAWLRDALRGFGSAAVFRWGMFEHYHRRLSVFFCGLYGAAQLTDDQRNLLRLLDCREEVKALDSIGDDPDSTTDDAVVGGRMVRDDDLFARPSVNANGSIPGDVFNCRRYGQTFPTR